MRTVLVIGLFVAYSGLASSLGAKSDTQFEIDKEGRVVRRDGDTIRWSAPLHRVLGVRRASALLWEAHRVKLLMANGIPVVHGARDSALLWDTKRVYVWDEQGVTALSATTGIVLWHSHGQTERLVLSGDLLLALGKRLPDGRWLTGHAVTTGAEVRKVRLPAGVITGVPRGEDWVFLSDKGVMRSSAGDKTSWITRFEREWHGDGGLVEAGGGDVVAFLYCGISDSGVQLVRLNTATGKLVWRAHCAPLGVDHSKYRHHAAVVVEKNRLRVTSRGSYGTFVEVLDLQTGRQVKRIVSDR